MNEIVTSFADWERRRSHSMRGYSGCTTDRLCIPRRTASIAGHFLDIDRRSYHISLFKRKLC